MDRELKGIRNANILCILACFILTLVTVIPSDEMVGTGIKQRVILLSVFLYITIFLINVISKKRHVLVSVLITLMHIYCGSIAAYFANSTMIFAAMAMFSAGVAYFNRVRVVNVIHAVLTSAIIVFFSFPTVKTGTGLDTILAQVRQFETIEVVATIVGIVLTDAFFLIWNTGRIRQTENMVEQERSSDELMKIIEAKADEARYATKSKSDFLASMSHEIRTPINSVLGMNEMILRESKEADIRKYAEDIQQAGNMLLSLINNILDFSKIESGKMEIMPVKYDLGMVLNDLKIFVSNRAKNKGLDLIIKASPDIPRTLYGDEIRIKQIVTNILTNAVKYTDTGSVTFEVDFDKADERSILLNIAVTDTGEGMKQEDLNKLFSPFERIDELRNRHIEGTGLGMSIVQQLLAMMGSRLKVKSEYGKGSTFSFTIRQEVIDWGELGDFSATLLAPKTDEENRDKELFTAPKAKILVVDDIKMNLNVIVGLLKRTKIRVDVALTGAEAVEMVKKTNYDIVFIDHMMPDMDGIETLETIKKDRFALCRNKPMVALTANAISGAREFYLEKGFVDYLSKPVNSKLLEKMIIDHLPKELIATGGNRDE